MAISREVEDMTMRNQKEDVREMQGVKSNSAHSHSDTALLKKDKYQ